MIYKIAIHNKTTKPIYYKLIDYNNDKHVEPKKIEADNIDTAQTDSTITNLHIQKDLHSSEAWTGAVPSSTYLEVADPYGVLTVYLENDSIPPKTIQDLQCGPDGCYSGWVKFLVVILLLTILGIICVFLKNRH